MSYSSFRPPNGPMNSEINNLAVDQVVDDENDQMDTNYIKPRIFENARQTKHPNDTQSKHSGMVFYFNHPKSSPDPPPNNNTKHPELPANVLKYRNIFSEIFKMFSNHEDPLRKFPHLKQSWSHVFALELLTRASSKASYNNLRDHFISTCLSVGHLTPEELIAKTSSIDFTLLSSNDQQKKPIFHVPASRSNASSPNTVLHSHLNKSPMPKTHVDKIIRKRAEKDMEKDFMNALQLIKPDIPLSEAKSLIRDAVHLKSELSTRGICATIGELIDPLLNITLSPSRDMQKSDIKSHVIKKFRSVSQSDPIAQGDLEHEMEYGSDNTSVIGSTANADLVKVFDEEINEWEDDNSFDSDTTYFEGYDKNEEIEYDEFKVEWSDDDDTVEDIHRYQKYYNSKCLSSSRNNDNNINDNLNLKPCIGNKDNFSEDESKKIHNIKSGQLNSSRHFLKNEIDSTTETNLESNRDSLKHLEELYRSLHIAFSPELLRKYPRGRLPSEHYESIAREITGTQDGILPGYMRPVIRDKLVNASTKNSDTIKRGGEALPSQERDVKGFEERLNMSIEKRLRTLPPRREEIEFVRSANKKLAWKCVGIPTPLSPINAKASLIHMPHLLEKKSASEGTDLKNVSVAMVNEFQCSNAIHPFERKFREKMIQTSAKALQKLKKNLSLDSIPYSPTATQVISRMIIKNKLNSETVEQAIERLYNAKEKSNGSGISGQMSIETQMANWQRKGVMKRFTSLSPERQKKIVEDSVLRLYKPELVEKRRNWTEEDAQLERDKWMSAEEVKKMLKSKLPKKKLEKIQERMIKNLETISAPRPVVTSYSTNIMTKDEIELDHFKKNHPDKLPLTRHAEDELVARVYYHNIEKEYLRRAQSKPTPIAPFSSLKLNSSFQPPGRILKNYEIAARDGQEFVKLSSNIPQRLLLNEKTDTTIQEKEISSSHTRSRPRPSPQNITAASLPPASISSASNSSPLQTRTSTLNRLESTFIERKSRPNYNPRSSIPSDNQEELELTNLSSNHVHPVIPSSPPPASHSSPRASSSSSLPISTSLEIPGLRTRSPPSPSPSVDEPSPSAPSVKLNESMRRSLLKQRISESLGLGVSSQDSGRKDVMISEQKSSLGSNNTPSSPEIQAADTNGSNNLEKTVMAKIEAALAEKRKSMGMLNGRPSTLGAARFEPNYSNSQKEEEKD